jgi:hypothetical protein
VPEIAKLVEYAHSVGLTLDNEARLKAAADQIAELLASMSEKLDGGTLAGLDSLMPGPDKLKGTARKAGVVN